MDNTEILKKIEELRQERKKIKTNRGIDFRLILDIVGGFGAGGAATSFGLTLKFFRKLWAVWLSPVIGFLAGALLSLAAIALSEGVLAILNAIAKKKIKKLMS